MSKVLLTGGSGFIAAHVLEALLRNGHKVVTTVRSHDKGKKILEAHPNVSSETLSYVIVPDISKEGAFNDAVVSDPPFSVVVHTASPFYFNHTDPVKDILDPAVKGTTGILHAIKAHAPSVQRVVITSSFAAMLHTPPHHPAVYNEKTWNPVTPTEALQPDMTYRASKTFAERAAWDFVAAEKPAFDLVALNPPLVFGPVINYLNSLDSINTSNQGIRDLVLGKNRQDSPSKNESLWVDVRDLAQAHANAVDVKEAGGKRFFVTAGFYTNKQIADIIRKGFPELKDKLPLADVEDNSSDGKAVYDYDNEQSIKVLGLNYKSLEETIKDSVEAIKKVDSSI